ncbi:unnamed protein product [Ophioblennius macclurei]
MAKKKRGETNSSRKNTESEKQTEHFSLMLDSSDDEAPEEVTFEDSKAQALRSMTEAIETVRREKELLKEKRRRRQELFQEQKKRKLLPADLLEEIDSAPSKKQKDSGNEDEQQDDEEEKEEGQKKKKKKKKKKGKGQHSRNLLGKYTVTTAKGPTVSVQQQAAADFIQSRLYGPGSCRTTNNEILSLQNKKGQNKTAAVQFVKKDWACQEKAKAEKEKKRWIHKQKLST